MDDSEVEALANRLLAASARRVPIAPLTADHPHLTVDDAYAIQLRQVARWVADGASVTGHKVGLTSAAMRAQLGVHEPDFGHLTDRMLHPADRPVDLTALVQPRVEPEIAFVLGGPLRGPGVTVAAALSAVAYAVPALEIIDSRIRDWRITLVDTIADNASSGGVVLGDEPIPLGRLDLTVVIAELIHNGQSVGIGTGADVLGSPVNALAWLANALGRYGVGLAAGHVVLPGAMTAARPVRPGDTVTGRFTGLGSVTARFVGAPSRTPGAPS